MSDRPAFVIEINGRVEPADGGYRARLVFGCAGLRVEEVGPVHVREADANQQLSDEVAEALVRIQTVRDGLHA